MRSVIAALLGLVAGLAAHDIGVQGLRDDPLRPLAGSCPACRQSRGWARPRCPHCSRTVGREIWVALAVAAGAVALEFGLGLGPHFFVYLGFFLLTAALTVTDLAELRIVDRLNLPGTLLLAVALLAVSLWSGDIERMIRGIAGAGAYFGGSTFLWFLARGQGFGAGDVKLSPVLGLFTSYLSWGTLGWGVFITAMVGGVLGVAAIVFGRAGMKAELPYGPAMVVGAWTAIVLAIGGVIPLPT